MAFDDRFVPRFAAEPPQDGLPYGRWEATLREHFLAACLRIDAGDDDLGEPTQVDWYPDRTWAGRTYVPATTRTTTGLEIFGVVSFIPGDAEHDPEDFEARADFTTETADRNPDWTLDLSEEVVDRWRGEGGDVAEMTLVWGIPMTPGGTAVVAELGGDTVDRCRLLEDRFTLLAPDAYRGDELDVVLVGPKGELARESLYADDDEDDGSE